MTGNFQTTGYPFLMLTKRHGLDYGDVLQYASQVDPNSFVYTLSTDERCKLYGRLPDLARHEIDALMRQPVWERGQCPTHS